MQVTLNSVPKKLLCITMGDGEWVMVGTITTNHPSSNAQQIEDRCANTTCDNFLGSYGVEASPQNVLSGK
jgi:hypothetical protein